MNHGRFASGDIGMLTFPYGMGQQRIVLFIFRDFGRT
jgi:hypothetical protein